MIYLVGSNDIAGGSSMAVAPGAARAFQLDIDELDGYSLSADSPNTDVTVWARPAAVGSFVEITATPIALSGNARETYDFEIRADAGIDISGGPIDLIPTIRVSI